MVIWLSQCIIWCVGALVFRCYHSRRCLCQLCWTWSCYWSSTSQYVCCQTADQCVSRQAETLCYTFPVFILKESTSGQTFTKAQTILLGTVLVMSMRAKVSDWFLPCSMWSLISYWWKSIRVSICLPVHSISNALRIRIASWCSYWFFWAIRILWSLSQPWIFSENWLAVVTRTKAQEICMLLCKKFLA